MLQLVLPDAALNMPAAQDEHSTLSSAMLNVPGAQVAQPL